MLRCVSGSVAKGQRLLCYQYKPYLSPEAGGGGGGGYVCARFELCGLVIPTSSKFVELFLIGWWIFCGAAGSRTSQMWIIYLIVLRFLSVLQ